MKNYMTLIWQVDCDEIYSMHRIEHGKDELDCLARSLVWCYAHNLDNAKVKIMQEVEP